MEITIFLVGACLLFVVFVIVRWLIERLEIGDLEKKAVFITGCDSGFGRDLAIRCAERGMPVFAGCLSENTITEYRELSKKFRVAVDAFLLDVTSDESVLKAKNYLEERTTKYGGLHGVVNNAGILGRTFFDDFLTVDDYKEVAEVNTWGVVRVTQAMKPLVKRTRGRVVVVTSVCSRVGIMGIGPYTASKFATSGYCDVIRAELRLFGVSVHVIEPGFFKTHLTSAANVEKQIDEVYSACKEEVKSEYGPQFLSEMRRKTTDLLAMISSNRQDYVCDAYFHALTAAYPRSRYQVGWDSILLYIPLSLLPTPIQDCFTRVMTVVVGGPEPASMIKKSQ